MEVNPWKYSNIMKKPLWIQVFHLTGDLLRAYEQLAQEPVLKEKLKTHGFGVNRCKWSITCLSLSGSEEQLSSW